MFDEPGLPIRVRSSNIRRLADHVLGDLRFEDVTVHLSVHFDSRGMTVRDFIGFLRLADGSYGRTYPRGFHSYAQKPRDQIQIAGVREGSTVLDFLQDAVNNVEIWRFVLAYLVIKTGPSILKGEAARNWAEAAKSAGEAVNIWSEIGEHRVSAYDRPRLTRRQRRLITGVIKAEPLLADLTQKDVTALVNAVEQVLMSEAHRLPSATRFSARHVLDVVLEVNGRYLP